MIADYIHPQSRVYQTARRLNTPVVNRRNPVVIGPRYLLSRFGVEASVPSYAFSAAAGSQLLPFNYSKNGVATVLPSNAVVDTSFTRVYGSKLEASLATFLHTDANNFFKVKSSLQSRVLTYTDAANKRLKGGSLATLLYDRPVTVGDIAYITDTVNSKTFKRTVVGLQGVTSAATFGSEGTDSNAGASEYNPATTVSGTTVDVVPAGWLTSDVTVVGASGFKGTLQGAVLDHNFGEEFTLTVATAGAVGTAAVNVTSKSGLYSGTIISEAEGSDANADADTLDYKFVDTTVDGTTMGGLTVVINSTVPLSQGQVVKFTVKSDYTRLATTGTKQVTVGLKSGITAYQLSTDTTYVVQVLTGTYNATTPSATGAVVRISDTAGLNTPAQVTLTDDTYFDLGTSGLQMKFSPNTGTPVPQGGLRKGDIYFVKCKAESASATEFDKVVLDGPAVDTTLFTNFTAKVKVEFRTAFSGEIAADAAADGEAWTIDATGVTIDSGLSAKIAGRSVGNEWCPFVDGVGSLSLYFRALLKPTATEGLIILDDEDDILSQLGPIDLDNDAAFGANEMLRGNAGQRIYAILTAGTDLASFAAALKKIESISHLYALAPMTEDLEIQQAVTAHVAASSAPTIKRFRRCYVGTDSPGEYALLNAVDNSPVTATIGDYSGKNVLVTLQNSGVDLTTLGIASGDKLKLSVEGVEYEISEVLSTTELLLVDGPALPVSPAVIVEVWAADTPESQANYVINRSKALGSARAANIWCENGKRLINGVLTTIPNRYLAAEIAGLRCALLKQQPLTRTEVTGVTTAASMYVRYNDELLDKVAANGTFIITQDAESGVVYVRHQLTTDTSEGALFYEDSIGVIKDGVSVIMRDVQDRYLGQKNVTVQTLLDMKNEMNDVLFAETQADVGENIGPALIRYENLRIQVDPTLADRAKTTVKCIVPLPFNLGDVELEFDQDSTLTGLVI